MATEKPSPGKAMGGSYTDTLTCCHCSEARLPNQLPHLNSAARYGLKRYAAELIDYAAAGDRVASSLVDCCNFILIEADRIEGGGR